MANATERTGRRSRRATSREAIIEAGMRLLDREGLEALSVRRIGTELGIAAMTVYTYLATKDALLDAISAAALDEFTTREVAEGPWEDQIIAMTKDLYFGIQEHPGVADLIMRRPPPVQALDRFRERMLTVLHRAGFSERAAVDALTALTCHAFGHATARRGRDALEPAAETDRLRCLPTGEFPLLVQSADLYAVHLSHDAFDVGLRALVAGLRVTLLSHEPPGSSSRP